MHNSNLKWGNCLAKAWVEYWSATFFKKVFFIVTLLKKYFLKMYLLLISPFFVFRTKIDTVWARYTNLVKVERLLVNQNRKWFFYYMYHYVLNINVIIFIMFVLYFSLLIQETASMWYFHCLIYMFYFLKLVLHVYLLVYLIERFADSFDWFAIFFFKDKVLVINALSIIKKICTNAKILEQLCLLTKLLPLSKFKYRWDFYGGKHS